MYTSRTGEWVSERTNKGTGLLLSRIAVLWLLHDQEREGVCIPFFFVQQRWGETWLMNYSVLAYPVKLNGKVSNAIPI